MKQFLKKIYPCLGAVIFFQCLFLNGLINNMSMSYMGNTSRQGTEYFINNFLGHIIFFILKIFFVYLILGMVSGIIVCLFIASFSEIIKKKISSQAQLLTNFLISGFIFMLFFFKDLINHPQVYMNNFYVKYGFSKLLTDFLTDNINPIVFTVIQILAAALIFIPVIISLYRISNAIIRKIFYAFVSIIIIIFLVINIFSRPAIKKHDRPNILILAADALRPDHFSGYGYSRQTTPNIDRLINEGISFRNAFIEVPRTFPSWVSILTGRFSSSHGIRHMFPTSRDLNQDFASVVKDLRRNGYETSVIGDYAADIFTRINLGFENVDTPYFNTHSLIEQIILESHTGLMPFLTGRVGLAVFPVLKDSAYFCPPEFVRDKVIKTISRSKKPFFIATFFSSTHFPYASPYPYYKLYAEKNYTGPYKYYKQRIISLDESKAIKISEEDKHQVYALYDSGLKAFDDSVGSILNFLADNDILDNTMIIVLSDHGENLNEDDLGMGHGEHFRGQYAIKIPLIIRYPGLGLKRKEINSVARHVDVAPTILSILNKPVPAYMEGVSLLPLVDGSASIKLNAYGETGIWFDNSVREDLFFQKLRIIYPDITFIAEADFHFDTQVVLKDEYRDLINTAKHRYVFDGRYKLIYMPLKDKILYELYDTINDPEEKNNIVSSDRNNFLRLKKLLFDWVQRNKDVIVKKDYIFPVLRY